LSSLPWKFPEQASGLRSSGVPDHPVDDFYQSLNLAVDPVSAGTELIHAFSELIDPLSEPFVDQFDSMIRLLKLFGEQNLGSQQLTLAPSQRFDDILDSREPNFVIVAVAVHLGTSVPA
jgi:hypothetical protein